MFYTFFDIGAMVNSVADFRVADSYCKGNRRGIITPRFPPAIF
jgi:hypothetical protein